MRGVRSNRRKRGGACRKRRHPEGRMTRPVSKRHAGRRKKIELAVIGNLLAGEAYQQERRAWHPASVKSSSVGGT